MTFLTSTAKNFRYVMLNLFQHLCHYLDMPIKKWVDSLDDTFRCNKCFVKTPASFSYFRMATFASGLPSDLWVMRIPLRVISTLLKTAFTRFVFSSLFSHLSLVCSENILRLPMLPTLILRLRSG